MEEEFRSEDYQGRSKEQVERTHAGMRIFTGFVASFIIILLTYTLFKYIIE